MPWSFGTQRKPGSPDTVDVSAGNILTQLSVLPPPIPWLTPIFALIHPITVSTDVLCSAPPALAESWSILDTLAALDPNQQPAESAKLQRMVEASIWPAYCEFTPPTTPDPEGEHQFGQPTGLQDVTFASNPLSWVGGTTDSSAGPLAADFWVFYSKCVVAPGGGTLPRLTIVRPDGATDREPILGGWASNLGGEVCRVIWRVGTVPYWGGSGQTTQMQPMSNLFRLYRPGDQTGRWEWTLSAWSLNMPNPPVVEPWAPASPVPPVFQFDDECALALCNMASNYPPPPPPPAEGQFSNDAVINLTNVGEQWTPITVQYTRALTELLNAIGGGYGHTFSDGIEATDGQEIDVRGSVGAIVFWSAGPGGWQMTFGHPEQWHEVGYVTWGDQTAWCDPVPLQVNPQFVGGWTQSVLRLSVSLKPGGTAWVTLIYPGSI